MLLMRREDLEQTLVLIKPDALKNSLTGYIMSQLSEVHTGLRFAGAKIVQVSRMLAEEHYAELRGKIFFPSLIEYIMGISHYPNAKWKRRVIAFVLQGPDAPAKIRQVVGPTNPHTARDEKPGSIRSMGTIVHLKDAGGHEIGDRMDNLIHTSSSLAEAEREIKLWFKPEDIPPLMRPYPTEVSDDYYYFKAGRLYSDYKKGRVCLLAPGNIAWKSDLEALKLHLKGLSASCTINSVVAKYLTNEVD
jgi:nucleoside-diphosphate kinase